MVNKALRIVLYSIFAISLLFVMPVNIYADTITTNNIKGINTVLLSKTQNQTNTNSYWYIYEHTITLDANYVGTINLNINLTYYNPSGSSDTYGVATISNKNFYVNGNTIKVNQMVVSDNYANQGPFASSSYLLNSSNVIKYDDIDSLQQIIDLLSDIYDNSEDIEGLSTNQLSELESIVSNTSLANQYLNVISQMKQWHIPIESYSVVSSAIMNNLELTGDSYGYQYFDYPVYKVNTNDVIVGLYGSSSSEYTWIMYSTVNFNASTIKQYFSFNGDVNIIEVNVLNRMLIFTNVGNGGLYKIKFKPIASAHIDISYIYNSNNFRYVPIYMGLSSNSNISTDFALQYGLSNQLLDDIHLIADGTNASSAASSQSDQANQQLQTDSNTLFSQEDSFKQNMQQSMNNIDTTFSLNNFGSSFMTSAQWVRTQYETLTNNTPFASLITFSLLVGLALIVIGKVYK